MKKVGFLIGLLVLVGCTEGGKAEAVQVLNHVQKNVEQVYIKAPMLWEVDLVDKRDGSRIAITLNDYGYQPGGKIETERLEKLAMELAAKIDTPMRNPTIDENGQVTLGQEQIILSESEMVEKLAKLSYYEKEFDLPIYITEPTVSEDELVGIDEHVLGEYRTSYNAYVQGRSKNIELSAAAIQNYVLGPGDEFSFNGVVGQRTKERGYQEAKEIVNKQFIVGVGGGICQTSSTLFNAIEAVGLKITERYSHSRNISYVPEGKDATVSWGGPDFRFQNSLSAPIIIRTEVSHERGEVSVKVLSYKS